MAEFCARCWDRLNETNDAEKKFTLSEELDLCEGCGEWKNVIVARKTLLERLISRLLNKKR